MEEVLYWRTKILHSSATHVSSYLKFYRIPFSHTHTITPSQDALQTMRTKLTAKIDQINDQLGCPLVPRTEMGEVLDCRMTSAQQLYKLVNLLFFILHYHIIWISLSHNLDFIIKRAHTAPRSKG